MTLKVRFEEGEDKSVKQRSNRLVPDPDVMLGQPYVRALPNGFQMALGRDALLSLGKPKRVQWEIETEPPNQVFVKLLACTSEGNFGVSYSREGKAGIITIPKVHQHLFSPKARYDIVGWSPPGESRKWARISLVPQFDKEPINNALRKGTQR